MLAAYKKYYNKVVLEESEVEQELCGRYPHRKSKWLNSVRHCIMEKEKDKTGQLLRSTFLIGGKLFMSLSAYKQSLVSKAEDIEKKCILTDVEISHNMEGTRLFFELDYRTTDRPLPSWDEAQLHLRVVF